MFHIPLLPTKFLKLLLIMHYYEWIIRLSIGNILWSNLNNHTRVTPFASTIAWAHAINDNLFLTCCSRNDKATRTHTERIYSPTLNLGNERIFSSWKILTTPLLVMILYLIYELRRMLKTYTHGNTLCLDMYSCMSEITIYITRRMSCGKNHRT